MVSVILTLLKILGILLLILLGLALLLILSLLLCPFRYELRGEAADLHTAKARGRVTWLGRLLWGQVNWQDGELSGFLRVAGIPVFRFPAAGKKQPQPEHPAPETEPAEASRGPAAPEASGPEEGSSRNRGTAEVQTAELGREKPDRLEADPEKRDPKEPDWEETDRQPSGGIKDRLSRLRSQVEQVLDFLQDEENQKLFVFLREQLAAVLKHILPRTVDIQVRVGLEDPAATGAVLGAVYMFYPLYEDHIRVIGEFEETVLEGKALLRGRIRILTLLIIGLRTYRHPAVQDWIRKKKKRGSR